MIDSVPVAGADDAERALAAAVDGARAMRELSAYERTEIVRRAADLVGRGRGARADDRARGGEAARRGARRGPRIPGMLRVSAAEGARLHGETVPVDAAANGAGKLGADDPAAVRDRGRDHAVQLSRRC